ncbi:MAG: hypothetical protein ACI4M6_06975 [Christensenellaceae bacterium]
MLSRKEKIVMGIIFSKCTNGSNCLISTNEIMLELPKKMKLKPEEIEKIIQSLEADGYFEVVYSDRNGQPLMCVNLRVKGTNYHREGVTLRREILKKILLGAIGAVATFVVGRILIYLFK